MAFTVIWILLLTVTLTASFMVELNPKSAIFRIGDVQELRCSVAKCPDSEKIRIIWTPLEDKPLFAKPQGNSSESVLIFDKVTKDHENRIVCKASCGHQTKQRDVAVKVYSFSRAPVISGHDHVLLGEENTLTCEVPGVYPAEYLEVQWLQGETVLHTQEGEADTDTVLSTYSYRSTGEEDNGKTITCRASHGLEGLPTDQRMKQTTVSLTVLSPPHEMRISETAAVQLGATLTLTCDADGNPKPTVVWRALRQDGRSVRVGENEGLVLSGVALSDAGDYECEASNTLGNLTARVNVIVQVPPLNTSISVSPAGQLMEGEPMSVSCRTDSVPAGRVVLRRVSEGLETELQSSAGTLASVSLASARLADSGLYECEAVNEHGSQRVSAQVTVKAFPLEVELSPAQGVITAERGSSLTLSCQASGCPHPLFFWKTLLDMPVHSPSQTRGNVSRLLLSPVELADEGVYACEVKCGSVMKSKHTEVKVFSFPASPVIESSGPSVEGEQASLRCTVPDVFPSGLLRLLWLEGERELLSETGPVSGELQNLTSVLSFPAGAGDQGRQITCTARLQMDGVPRTQREKSATTTLTLHYAPRNTSIIVTPGSEVKEGMLVSVSCRTDSVPAGRVVLRRVSEGLETELQSSAGTLASISLASVRLADSGLYECEAVNEHGSQRVSAQVTVKAPPRNTTVEVLPSTQVQEGQNVTICCRSISFPPPAAVLRKLGADGSNGMDLYSPDGTFLLVNLTPNDTGRYQVNVTNDLGYETEIFTINVMEKHSRPPPSWNYIVFSAVALGIMAITTGLVVDYLRRARMKGWYELAKSNPSTA